MFLGISPLKLLFDSVICSRLTNSLNPCERPPEMLFPVIISLRNLLRLLIFPSRDPIKDGFSMKTSSSKEDDLRGEKSGNGVFV